MKYMQSIEGMPLSEICIEPYQRVLNNARVKRIADNFDPARVGVLLLSKRGSHSYAIVDGQHRLCAMRQIGVQDAVCIVVVGMTYEDEANYFRIQTKPIQDTIMSRSMSRKKRRKTKWLRWVWTGCIIPR